MSQSVFTFDDAIRGIRKRKYKVAAVVVLVPVLVMTATLLAPKEYKSTAKLFVRLGRENSSMDATATLGQAPVIATPLSREAEIKSISEMILNRALFAEVVDEIGPAKILKKKVSTSDGSEVEESPGLIDHVMGFLVRIGVANNLPQREKAIIKLQKNLVVEPVDKTNVVLIEYESHSAELSQQVVQMITDRYLVRHGEIHRSKGAYPFLEEQTKRLGDDLTNHEKEFETLRKENQIIDIDAQRIVLVNRLAKITQDKLDIDARQEAAEEELNRLEKLKETTPREIVIEETVGVGNDGVDGMRQELFRLEIQKEDLLSKFDATHNRVKAIEIQIAKTQAIVDKVEASRKETKKGPNPVFQKIEMEINAKKPLFFALSAQSKTLQKQIDQIIERSKTYASLETRFTQLRRTIDLENVNYRKYVNNLEEAKIDSLSNSEKLSNISVAQPASLEIKPSKPDKLINLVIGVMLGMMLGFGWAIFKEFRSVMSDSTEELARDVELPIVGSMRTVPQGANVERELATNTND